MLKNYILSALFSWYRRKVFAALTILGMAFSIILTTCAATFWALLRYSMPPENNKEQMQFISPEFWDTEKNVPFSWNKVQETLSQAGTPFDLSAI
ncbi:MAG: hypothetical protein OEX02_18260, partial [Cyclobacteriaceae bacterium]|nr:hypothetical protein [Cyclobacteriaceae bacterium]